MPKPAKPQYKLTVEYLTRLLDGKMVHATIHWTGQMRFYIERGDLIILSKNDQIAAFRTNSWIKVLVEEVPDAQTNQT